MIHEELGLQVDIERLRDHLLRHVLHRPPVMAGRHFGGWSVLSSTGSYTDGWIGGHKMYDASFRPDLTPEQKADVLGLKSAAAYNRPTEICTGYLADVMKVLSESGLNPTRARLTLLKANGQSSRHTDGRPEEYSVRLHIPIITNALCTFETDDESTHLPASGRAYLIHVNRMHQVFNRGETDRIHLIMNAEDRANLSRYHRFQNRSPSP